MGFFSSFSFQKEKGKIKKETLENIHQHEENRVLLKENIKLNLESVDKYQAIKMAGKILVDSGYVEEDYIEAMIQREKDLSTYIGCGVAIPHGVGKARKLIKKSGIVVLQFPKGVDFGVEKAYLVIGIAGVGDKHLQILSNIATIIGEDQEKLEHLKTTKDVQYIYETFTRIQSS
ncbi:PTS sugar transporter subunit IIA [Garciella nitratireducens]|uniref:Mannitol-specific phosphotransferase enzyme IIA component n=1 Tax=Garciella nitratireducens DSM 15102 TaxID=1121911 RepID=A0A1T4KXX1_9FIRM|nr:PTS sugar transporter subunit IIA [Garciella nitratireducens]SJZ47266.1 PTS system, mannitol-specific IIA component [Garciella nitratireducens DSM 15102]